MTLVQRRHGRSDELDEIAALATPLAVSSDLDPVPEHIGDAFCYFDDTEPRHPLQLAGVQ